MKLKIPRLSANNIFYLCLLITVLVFLFVYTFKLAYKIDISTKIDSPSSVSNSLENLNIDLVFNNEIGDSKIVDMLVDIINKSKHTIEIAVFSLGSDRVVKSLYDASDRGVKVILVLNSSIPGQQNPLIYNDLPDSVEKIDAGRYDQDNSENNVHMHHKFMIVDRGYDEQIMVSGSVNFTDIGEKYNQSFFFITRDKYIIDIYGKEFDLLKEGIYSVKKLGSRSYDPWSSRIQYNDSFLELWMSPGFSHRSVKYRILDLIKSATSSIKMMMWDFTDERIASSLLKKASEGIHISLIAENSTATSTYSVVPSLLSTIEKGGVKNFDIVLDTKSVEFVKEIMPYGFNPYLHQHTMIVDDSVVVFGTNNWSQWGFYKNDEDTLITDNKKIIEGFNDTFNYLYKLFK